ncbi:MAG: outer membrane protein assembly factor BamE [Candidatus Omnitrophica bacterium]|nr:outer membrane protein assembly factor BamE [Candidatus Omnitrophota bacterium]
MRVLLFLVCMTVCFSGCASAPYHRDQLRDDSGDRLTVGTVQKEIKVGMSSAQVAEILGSPNVVTTDEQRREVWVYDKISTEVYYSESGAGLKFMTSGSSGGATKTQRTLTVVIKFDSEGKVRDFAYHTSRF